MFLRFNLVITPVTEIRGWKAIVDYMVLSSFNLIFFKRKPFYFSFYPALTVYSAMFFLQPVSAGSR